jgi:site-specific DNA-cytosine methylase
MITEKSEVINAMPDGTSRTIKAQYQQTSRANLERVGSFGATGVKKGIRIRKLTPTECYKLMGFSAEDCKKVSEGGISNAQLYKQAGNSIVVNVLEAIFTSLGERYEEFTV